MPPEKMMQPPLFNAFRSLLFLVTAASAFTAHADDALRASQYDVIWETAGSDASDSMPLGNGELGINLWVEADGDLHFYLGRNDAFTGIAQLAKVGWVRVSLSPNPFAGGASFRQHLKLRDGVCEIVAGEPGEAVRLQVFVDADTPVVHVVGTSEIPRTITARAESWREEPQAISRRGKWTMMNAPMEVLQSADIFPEAGDDSVVWYHRNRHSLAFEETIRVQSLQPIRHLIEDPLINRTFGGWVTGAGFAPTDNRTLVTAQPQQNFHLRVASPCEQTPSADDWLALAESIAAAASDGAAALARTAAHWQAFWARSYVSSDFGPFSGLDEQARAQLSPTGGTTHGLFLGQDELSATTEAMTVGKAHTLQRFMQAAAGRSDYPIKFNGSIFNVEPTFLGIEGTPDWRRWGDCHWWQNVRMPYHAMLMTGDFDLMHPLFDTYERIRPHAEARTHLYYGVEGLHFWETMTIWGTMANRDYGWDRQGKAIGEVINGHTGKVWNQGLELVNLMLDYYDHTGDTTFVREHVVPMALPVLRYFDSRFAKDGDGRIIIDPTQAVETYWFDVVNDMPNVAGLHEVSRRLTALPEALTTPEARALFEHIRAAAPEIPFEVEVVDGAPVRHLAPAQAYHPRRRNVEQPESYAVWPFRIFGLGHPEIEAARQAFHLRERPLDVGWGYDGNTAALLGLTDEAVRILRIRLANANSQFRWPATWGPNYDWVPDQCHGGNLMNTIHYMLLQPVDGKLHLLPAWPLDRDVAFKLHAPEKTTVELELKDGAIAKLTVLPETRRADIILPTELHPVAQALQTRRRVAQLEGNAPPLPFAGDIQSGCPTSYGGQGGICTQ